MELSEHVIATVLAATHAVSTALWLVVDIIITKSISV